ncbi:hypothetical protein CQW44_10850 [Streptomyces griseofuscus]|uniref:Transposase n=1 Tax=Streptomyces griseofuscus TaxID=146922 RepID=A0A426SAG8_9ACTN|nr:hypothetical protein [Streptomyces griseofuscus]RRQ87420.1 hypothetical protein CQW44_10850 [Streptomyces griseofuscus]
MPARFSGERVRVLLRGNELMVFNKRELVARHPRLTRRGAYRDILDHYLEILLAKAGAMRGSTALAAARAEGTFSAAHEAFWAAARKAHGDAAGTRALIEVLLHRRLPAEAVQIGVTAAVKAGSTSPDVVAIEARKAEAAARDPGPEDDKDDPPPWTEGERRTGADAAPTTSRPARGPAPTAVGGPL